MTARHAPARRRSAGLTDTVTHLTVAPGLPTLGDRRNVTIYELLGAEIPLWGYAYPARLTGGTLLVSGQRHGDDTIEVGRTIAAGRLPARRRADAPTRSTPAARCSSATPRTAPVLATVERRDRSAARRSPSSRPPATRRTAHELGLDAGSRARRDAAR